MRNHWNILYNHFGEILEGRGESDVYQSTGLNLQTSLFVVAVATFCLVSFITFNIFKTLKSVCPDTIPMELFAEGAKHALGVLL